MADMFENNRINRKSAELRAYKSESETDAKRRLEAAGWNFSGVYFEFENQIFKINKAPDLPTAPDNDKDEAKDD
jgi:hypothetical protein